jgi:hypothetical protein
MFPEEYEPFEEITLTTYEDLVEGEMDEINDKLDTMPAEMTNAIIGAMYGKMEIHDDVMDIYNIDGEIIRTFNLFDISGNPTTSSAVYKREIKI